MTHTPRNTRRPRCAPIPGYGLVVPYWVLAGLHEHLGEELRQLRVYTRGRHPEFNAELVELCKIALHVAEWGKQARTNPETATPSPQRMTTRQAADRLGIGERRVRQLITAGDLPAEHIGRSYLVLRDHVETLARRRQAAA